MMISPNKLYEYFLSARQIYNQGSWIPLCDYYYEIKKNERKFTVEEYHKILEDMRRSLWDGRCGWHGYIVTTAAGTPTGVCTRLKKDRDVMPVPGMHMYGQKFIWMTKKGEEKENAKTNT